MWTLKKSQATSPRSPLSYAVELACWATLWSVNLYQMTTRFRTMSFLMAASAVMCLVFGPALMWQAVEGLRREAR